MPLRNKMKIIKKKRYEIDFTNNNWKSNYLIGNKIVTRPYKRVPLVLAILIFISGIVPCIVWNFATSGATAIKFLGRFG